MVQLSLLLIVVALKSKETWMSKLSRLTPYWKPSVTQRQQETTIHHDS